MAASHGPANAMNNPIRFLSIVLLCSTGSAQAALLPGDPARGQALHKQQCMSCHDTGVYTRNERRVKSVEGLIGQVNGCVRQIGLNLNRDQVNDLVNYLNESFYRFK